MTIMTIIRAETLPKHVWPLHITASNYQQNQHPPPPLLLNPPSKGHGPREGPAQHQGQPGTVFLREEDRRTHAPAQAAPEEPCNTHALALQQQNTLQNRFYWTEIQTGQNEKLLLLTSQDIYLYSHALILIWTSRITYRHLMTLEKHTRAVSNERHTINYLLQEINYKFYLGVKMTSKHERNIFWPKPDALTTQWTKDSFSGKRSVCS